MEWYVLILASAFIFGIAEVIKKKVLMSQRTLQFSTAYYIVCFFVALILLPKVNFYLTGMEWFLISLKSVLLAVAVFAYFKLLRHYEISEIAPLKNLSPLFLLVLGFLLLNEAPSIINLSGIGLLILGAYAIEADHRIINLKKPFKVLMEKKGIILLVYLVFISFCAVIDKFIVKTVDVYSYLFIQIMLIAAIFIAIDLFRNKGFADIKNAFKRDWLKIAIAGVLVFITDILYLNAIVMPSALIVLAIPIKRMSTLVSAIIGGELFHEKGLKIKIPACIIMIIGAWLVIL